ncbi:MAG: PQQ-binding-like beta-propeller repeat protein [Phycisphaerales bacterium]|nr:PQQ-binding-like beta-propeller repeat protein [Phycisphaerales bacterium]
MVRNTPIVIRLTTAAVGAAIICGATDAKSDGGGSANWPQFRGMNAAGVSDGHSAATRWDASKNENIGWKTPIPGLGHSCPVIWGEKLFVTTAISGKDDPELKIGLYGDVAPVEDETVHKWQLFCLDKRTGGVLWSKAVFEGVPKIKRHTKASHANATPATDGKHVVVCLGSEGLYCYTVDGELVWKKDIGVLDSGWYVMPGAQWGFGSSPIIHEGRIILQCDVQKNSFLAAFDVSDGKEVWRVAREEVPTWSTPTIYTADGATRIAVNGYRHIGGYELETGREAWRLNGGGDIPVPTPVVAHDLIYITSAHGPGAPLYAIRTAVKGDITPDNPESPREFMAWSYDRIGNYMQTPIVYGDLLYCCRDNGVLTCYDARSGEKKYRERLGTGRTGFTASPVAADGKIYFTSEEGDVYTVKAGPEFNVLSTNPLGEICMATPAISEGVLFFRTQHHVMAVKEAGAPGGATGAQQGSR